MEGIHVMKVCPGVVATNFRDHVLQGKAPEKVQGIQRTVTPEQVAEAIVMGIRRKRRTVYVPKIGRFFAMLEAISSRCMDFYLRRSYQ